MDEEGRKYRMIYELRTYEIVPELFEEYISRADNLILPTATKLGVRLIGFWRAVSEDGGSLVPGERKPIPAQIVCVLAWESMEERSEKLLKMGKDEDWRKVVDYKYYKSANSKIIEPTAYSPLQ
ncbi:MAG: NIPSNAP family protein [Dehalococcoidia bacterium]|nr:NIPSNAP family protein [Dehalococcoidia bacterium]